MSYRIKKRRRRKAEFPIVMGPAREWAIEMIRIAKKAIVLVKDDIGEKGAIEAVASLDKAQNKIEKRCLRKL